MAYNVLESDWKLFRELLPEWQEEFMGRVIGEYAAIIDGPGSASDRFWKLERRLNFDKHTVGVVADMTRSMMTIQILNLIKDGVITLDNLADFSDDLKEHIIFCIKTLSL